MLRNILGAIGIFALITLVAVLVALSHDRTPPPSAPQQSPDPAAAAPLALEPPGSFAPAATPPALTLRSHARTGAYVRFYRLHDRALMLRLYRGVTRGALSAVAIARLLAEAAVPQAALYVAITGDRQSIPWPEQNQTGDLPPGFYVVTAAHDAFSDAQTATWFVRSDLHVMVAADTEGWHALCQNLRAHRPAGGVALSWFGLADNPVLAGQYCKSDGSAMLAAAKIPAGNPLQLLFAEDAEGQLAFLPLDSAPAASAAHPQRDLLTTDRAHYEAGQKLYALALGDMPAGKESALALIRPDGLRVLEQKLPAPKPYLIWQDIRIPPDAAPGVWQVALLSEGGVKQQTSLQVGTPPPPLQTSLRLVERRNAALTLAARITGDSQTPRNHQPARLQWRWENIRQLPAVSPDYAFGGYDQPSLPPPPETVLVTGGVDHLTAPMPAAPQLPYPVQARAELVPLPAGNFIAQQTAAVSFPTRPWALGVKAEFGDLPVPEGGKAEFKIALFKTGAIGEPPPLRYELVTERRSFRWSFDNGRWNAKADVAAAAVAWGDVKLDGGRQGRISVTAGRGAYRLDVFTPDRKLVSQWRFQAGAAPPPPAAIAELPLRIVRQEDGQRHVVTRAAGLVTMVAADARIGQLLPDAASSMREVRFALDPALRDGANILVLASQSGGGAQTTTLMARGAVWLPPEIAPDLLPGHMEPPPDLTAAAQVSIPVRLDAPPDGKPVYAQIIAVPVSDRAGERQMTAKRAAPEPRRIHPVSNIFGVWPQTEPDRTPEIPRTAAAASSLSSIAAIAPGGRGAVTLELPEHRGPVRLHLLLWNDQAARETTQIVNLSPPQARPAAPPAVAAVSLPTLDHWACREPPAAGRPIALPPVAVKGKAARGKNAAKPNPSFAVLTPVALPDLPQALAALLAARSVRSSAFAEFLLTAADYEPLLLARGITPEFLRGWRDDLWSRLLRQQQGDGGIAEFPGSGDSDLAATAVTLRAWRRQPPVDGSEARAAGMTGMLKRRLDNAWNAEHELPGRTEAFYALSLLNQIDAAALRYFVEKFGNQIRDAVHESELAAMLRQIQDHDKSRAFAARAMAQLPSLRHEDRGRGLRVLAILARHELMPATELAEHLSGLATAAPVLRNGWLAATGLAANLAVVLRLPEWQVDINGRELRWRGFYAAAIDPKIGLALRHKQGPALLLCSDDGPAPRARSPAPETGKTADGQTGSGRNNPARSQKTGAPPALIRTFYTASGQLVAPLDLESGKNYVLVMSGRNWRAGAGEIDLPLPPGLIFRAAFPGGAIAGTYGWLGGSDPVAVLPGQSGVLLAFNRSQAGDGKIALLLEAARTGRYAWEAARLTQSSGEQISKAADVQVQ